MSQDQTLLTRREACDLLKISLSTLERWERDGRLVPLRMSPAVIRYRRSDITRLIEDGTRSGAAS